MNKGLLVVVILISLQTTYPMLQKEALHVKAVLQEEASHFTESVKTVFDIIDPTLEETVEGVHAAIINNPYKSTKSWVKKGNTIGTGEARYRAKKMPMVKAALEKLLDCLLENTQIPTIAAIFSGGGLRAALGTTGSLYGLEKEHFLPCITYTVGLSGSTWTITPWLASNMPLSSFKKCQQEQIAKPFHRITEQERLLIADMIAVRQLSDQKLSLVDIYGGLLGNRLLTFMEEKRHMTYLSDLIKVIRKGTRPYPVCVTVGGNPEDTSVSWYTWTPHKVANLNYGIAIPTFGCGRTYENKHSTNFAPEIALSVLLGTWGSAFAANWETIFRTAEEKLPQYIKELEILKQMINPKEKTRPIPCELKLPNFTKGMGTPFSNYKTLEQIDAGTDINLPYPAVSGICPERAADILWFFDFSANGNHLGEELLKCAEYAEKNKLPFPIISVDKVASSTISIFSSDDPKVPLVIYMPGVSDPQLWKQYKKDKRFKNLSDLSKFDLQEETNNGRCQTQHFQYPEDLSALVADQMTFNIRANREKIIEAIQWKTNKMPQ